MSGFADGLVPEVVYERKHGFKDRVICADVGVSGADNIAQLRNRPRDFLVRTTLPDKRYQIADHDEFCRREFDACNRLRECGIQQERDKPSKCGNCIFSDVVLDGGCSIQPLFQTGESGEGLGWCFGDEERDGCDVLENPGPRCLDFQIFIGLNHIDNEIASLLDCIRERSRNCLKTL